MDELVQKAFQQAAVLKKPSQLNPWKFDEPWPQQCYIWDSYGEVWQPIKPPTSPADHQAQFSGITTVALYSWNIDFMLPFAETRMSAALAHLDELTKQAASTAAVVINLQECHPSDLINISQKQWVRERFYITDLDTSGIGRAHV